MTEPVDHVVLQAFVLEFAKVQKWFDRIQAQATPPAAGSDLADDDVVLAPVRVSITGFDGLSIAIDHLHALKTLITDAHVIHAQATFTLLRVAIENAATALWVLAPADADIRRFRTLKLRWAVLVDEHKARDALGVPSAKTRDQHKATLQKIARNCGLTQDQVAKVAASPTGYQTIVREASEAVPSVVAPTIEPTWSMCSGIVHGRPWATQALLARTEVPSVTEDVRGFRMSADEETLLRITRIACLMVGYGWYHLDKRSR